MEILLKSDYSQPYLSFNHSIITNVNGAFIELTGFCKEELHGKSIMEFCDIIRIPAQHAKEVLNGRYAGYIFTKELSPIEVDISLCQSEHQSTRDLIFVGKKSSRLEDQLLFVEQVFIENITGAAIYSVPELVLLKANQKYFDFFPAPFNQVSRFVGKSITECIIGFTELQKQNLLHRMENRTHSFMVKEFSFEMKDRGMTYWNSVITPIYENGKAKYVYITTTDVTEEVLSREHIKEMNKVILSQKEALKEQNQLVENQKKELEQKNQLLNNIIENLSEGIILRDQKGNFIKSNPMAQKLIYGNEQKPALRDIY